MLKIVHLNVQTFTFALGFLVPFTYISSNLTIGNQNNNLSVGYGFIFMGVEKLQQSAFKTSANLRFNKNIYLLTENYLICNLGANVKYSFSGCTGIRYIIKNNSFKLGVFYSQEFPFQFPVVGYSRYLYKKSKF